LAIVSIGVLLFRWRQQSRARLAVGAASVAMLVGYIAVILRHPIVARVPDLGALFAITGTWTVSELVRLIRADIAFKGAPSGSRIQLGRQARWVRAAVVGAVTGAAVTAVLFSAWKLGNVGEQVDKTDVLRGVRKAEENLADMVRRGTIWPWEDFWPTSGVMPDAIRYLNACTAPSDEVLVTWNAPEYYFFARRKFGSGLALFLPPRAFTTARDQQRMLSRLRHQHVPVVMINETRREEFSRAYPLIEAYLQTFYEPIGQFTIYDGSRISIAVRHDERGAGSWGGEGWPCGFDARRAHS
jgi:hypothetical protein